MAIRFYCHRCGQLLSIASRKAGTIIDCPECGTAQEVPSQEAGDAAISLAAAFEESQKPADILPAPSEDTLKPVDLTTGGPSRNDYILLPRRTIYRQGVLFVVVGLVALGMGFLIGRGGVMKKASDAEGTSDSAEADPVLVEGHLTFEPASGKTQPDHNAAIIVWPQSVDIKNGRPDKRIPSSGIRSLDPPPAEDYGSLRRIRELGGCYARADKEGRFSLVLPDSGRYHLLLISHGAARPDGSQLDASDLEAVARLFRRPDYFVGEQQYRLTLEKFEGRAQIEHHFGQSRKR